MRKLINSKYIFRWGISTFLNLTLIKIIARYNEIGEPIKKKDICPNTKIQMLESFLNVYLQKIIGRSGLHNSMLCKTFEANILITL